MDGKEIMNGETMEIMTIVCCSYVRSVDECSFLFLINKP